MARTLRRCLTAWSKLSGVVEPENSASIPQIEEQDDAIDGKDVLDHKPDIDF